MDGDGTAALRYPPVKADPGPYPSGLSLKEDFRLPTAVGHRPFVTAMP